MISPARFLTCLTLLCFCAIPGLAQEPTQAPSSNQDTKQTEPNRKEKEKQEAKATKDKAKSDAKAASAISHASGSSVEQALMQTERDWADASKRKDTAWMEKHYAAEYTWTGPDGMMNDRAKDIADAKESSYDSAEVSDMRVRVNGDTAVVTGITTVKGKYKDQDISGTYRWTDTFIKRKGEWKVLASQSTRIAQPQTAQQ